MIRPWLRWSLAVTAVLSVLAWVWDGQEPPAATVQAGQAAFSPPPPARVPVQGPTPEAGQSRLGPAAADPFVGTAAVPAVQAPVVAVAAALVGPVLEPPPAPPPLTYRFLGRMTDPGGQLIVMLARPDKEVKVSVGTRLDEGYVVESITAEAVRLHYAPLGARATIALPPEPQPAQPADSVLLR